MLGRIIAVSAILLSGCGYIAADVNQSRINTSLQVGMSRDAVIADLGQPDKREAYGGTEFLLYKTRVEGLSDKDRMTPIAIVDGKVVGWGSSYYEQLIKADITIRQR